MSKTNQFVLRVDTDNADFDKQDCYAFQAIFAQIMANLTRGNLAGMVRDRNGNTVGEFVWNMGPTYIRGGRRG